MEEIIENEEEIFNFLLAGRPKVPVTNSTLSKKEQIIVNLKHKIKEKRSLLESIDTSKLPDKGFRIKKTIEDLENKLQNICTDDSKSNLESSSVQAEPLVIENNNTLENNSQDANFEKPHSPPINSSLEEANEEKNVVMEEIRETNEIGDNIEIIEKEEEDMLKEIEEQLKVLSINDGLIKLGDPIDPQELLRKEERKERIKYGSRGYEIQKSRRTAKILPIEEGIIASKNFDQEVEKSKQMRMESSETKLLL